MKLNDRTTSFDHVKQFYEKDRTLTIKSAPKLTNIHMYKSSFQKVSVSLAAIDESQCRMCCNVLKKSTSSTAC